MKPFNINTSSINGINLLDASAGTGKTFTIEGIYVRLILETGLNVENILVVTYTEAATNELRERILNKLRLCHDALLDTELSEDSKKDPFVVHLKKSYKTSDSIALSQSAQRLKLAIDSFDESVIFTIHGFCQRLLTDFAFESNSTFDTELITSTRPFIEDITRDYWRSLFYESDFKTISILYKEFPTPDSLLDLYLKTASHLSIKFEPVFENEDLEYWIKRSEDSYQAAIKTWKTHASELEDQLNGFSSKSYQKRWLSGRIQAMNLLFDLNEFDADKLKYFCQSIIEKSTNKDDFPRHKFFTEFQELYDSLKVLLICLKKDYLSNLRIKLKDLLTNRNFRCFDDLLLDVKQALQGNASEQLINKVQSRYQAALIDEFQDTDPVQYFIFQKLFATSNHPLFFIGDPKQSIYQFRGADIHTYCQAKRFVQDKNSEKNYNLDTNYRSDKNLVNAVNSFFSFRNNAFIHNEIDFIPSNSAKPESRIKLDNKDLSPFQIWFLEKTGEKPFNASEANTLIASACASEIVNLLNYHDRLLLDEIPVLPQDICVLVRSHVQAEMMHNELILRQVPCVLKTKATIFESMEFRDLLKTLQAIAEFRKSDIVRSALITELSGYSGDDVFACIIDDSRWEKIIDEFHTYNQIWREEGFYAMIRSFLSEKDVRTRLLNSEKGERKLTNLLHSVEVFHKAETEQKLSITGLIKWGRKMLSSKQPDDEEEIRLESDENAVKIMTIHISKGLEFPIVFCPFSWKGSSARDVIFHQNDEIICDLGSEKINTNRNSANQEELAENLRLLYVALTRAKHQCHLVWGDINKTDRSPLAYLLHEGKIKDRDLWNDLLELTRQSKDTIKLDRLPEATAQVYRPSGEKKPELIKKIFDGKTGQIRRLSSYSSLTRNFETDSGLKDHDALLKPPVSTPDSMDLINSFHLPKGSITGICIHEILEETDFREKDKNILTGLIADKLTKYHISEEWIPVTLSMISSLLNHKLKSGFFLADLPAENRINEMEFYFPTRETQVNKIKEGVKKSTNTKESLSFLKTLEKLDFKTTRGFMKGFIDLVFLHEEKYYIVDWKTNHLGNEYSNYKPDILEDYMISHAYNLQFYIYLLALHKYLKNRLPDYDFKKHIGGVYYFFLRGISPETNAGVYFNDLKDSFSIVSQLDTCFCG